jgi:hypothetical protein
MMSALGPVGSVRLASAGAMAVMPAPRPTKDSAKWLLLTGSR